jgi:multiple sugar transport system substrate-binding protein
MDYRLQGQANQKSGRNKEMNKKAWRYLCAPLLLASTAACGGADPAADTVKQQPAKQAEPVELTFLYTASGYPDADFMRDYGDPIKRKYPHISIKFIQSTKGNTLQELIVAKADIDVIFTSIGALSGVIDSGISLDLAETIQTNKFDLNRFEPSTIDMVRNMSGGKVLALPIKATSMVLFYNKDLFDKFGVAYPKDGMTWDDAYEIAKKMTRNDGGQTYRGFVTSLAHLAMTNQYSLDFIDPKTKKATFDNGRWNPFMDNLVRFFQIPGYGADAKVIVNVAQSDMFYKERTAAMLAHFSSNYPRANEGMNWDVVTFPTFKDRPGVGAQPYPAYFSVASTSKHKEEAFQAIAHLTSDEVQMEQARIGNAPVLKSQSVRAVFGQDLPDLKGKNTMAMLAAKFADPRVYTKYDGHAQSVITTSFTDIITGAKDTNTSLGQAAAILNAKIAEIDGK